MNAPSANLPDGANRFARVAVPVPLPALTYAIPSQVDASVGCRVRVEVGRRRLVGVVVGVTDQAPRGVRVKPLLEVLDLEPVVPSEMLALAEFVAEYYMAPIGEAVRSMVPSGLPPWGDRRVSLTDAGAVAPARDAWDRALVDYLMAHPRARLAEVQRAVAIPDLGRRLLDWRQAGRVSVEEPGRRGTRYVKAVEIAPGELADHLVAAGRSPAGRAVLEVLAAWGRPATLREVTAEVGCGSSVVRRLSKLGLVREFTQPERLSLGHHRLGEAEGGSGDEPAFTLRGDQTQAVEALVAGLEAQTYRPFLLHGMTGSGKTEVYLRVARRCLDLGRGTILLVPEIALVPALAGEVRRRFGSDLAILHSNLGSAERQQEWERIRRGEARVVLGARSALLAPVVDLGFVVVDEEHDSAYKQDQVPRYHGRDLALWRARESAAVALVVSATPSLESRRNVEIGKLGHLQLTARVGHGRLPEGIMVDLRQEPGARKSGEVFFSGTLQSEIRRAAEADEQIILLRNRRGYAPVLLCRACGEDYRCEDCGLPMTYHLRGHRLACHWCGAEQIAPRSCTTCGEAALEPMGAGTERVEERFRELFPGVTVDVLDADAGRRKGGAAAVLERFSQGRTQVLIGTQMVAKGHHFPRVSLAAVLSADTYLRFPDFRAVERTYALLTQLAGRAGRGERPGRVVIQTYHPDHYAIRAALDGNDEAFASQEMHFRRTFRYPPFSRMVQVLAHHPDRARAEGVLIKLRRALVEDPRMSRLRLFGPAKAPLERLRGEWRFQLQLRGASAAELRRVLGEALNRLKAGERADLVVDVDPHDLM